ncbi:MAG: DNA polymerase III subunit alpha, partial [Chitinophagales bacterium]|nr:DNA polymerase III subunit alpha [Chitinophagales bacterium]
MHLNCHTYFSFKFGTMSPEALLKEAGAKGVGKFVLTDINNTSAVLDLVRLSPRYKIDPVVGIDFRNGIQQQFIGIAKNHEGFHELNQFLSKCLQDGEAGLTGRRAVPTYAPEFQNAFVIYPFSTLIKEERAAFPENKNPSHRGMRQSGNVRDEQKIFSTPKLTADKLNENEFIGIKPSDLNRLRFSPWKNHPEKLVILTPVTFRTKTDFNIHRLLRAIDNNILLSKLPWTEQASPDEIMLTEEELESIFSVYPQIIQNTKKLLDACEIIDFEFDQSKNKKYYTESIKEDRQLLLQLCEEGMHYRYPTSNPEICKRFQKEIDLISDKNFTSYFLINHDIVRYARSKNYFYVGRGSGANSMVAYLLRITDVDPIELDLYFERFINPSRKNPPDFDIDFSWNERDDVIDYIFYRSPYGENYKDCIALLATYSEMKDNAVIRELGKVFGLPKAEIDSLSDNIIHSGSADHIISLIIQYGKLLYSFPSHRGIHAGGILISEKPITYYTALSNPPKGFPLTQFSMQEAEDVGFAKYDILSQRGLGKIKDAVVIIKQNTNQDIDIHDVKRFKEDEKAREHLQQAKLMGCFYVESPAMRMLLTKLKASTYLDLVAASSIIRPGVAQSGMMQEYIKRFHDPSRREYAHPIMKKLMEETFGIMVYQEDVIKVAHHFGKLSLAEADKLRRGMGGKYKGRQEFLEVKEKFFSNCRAESYDEKLIHEVWFQMETFGGYAFAKGHSAS